VIIGHGNGPQWASSCAGRRSRPRQKAYEVPLDVRRADTQGAIGMPCNKTCKTNYCGG
jgi:carbamate kinase